jgi:benzylsuccinate CoA-transferase BbsF subunit
MPGKPLKGVRVVEVTHHVTGPVTTQVLADCGAETIQIETVSRRGLMGGGAGFGPAAGGPPPHRRASTGRLSVSLNFQSPRGLELARKLISSADIFVENLAGGTLARRGLGYEDIRKLNPGIIYLPTCMQGQTGPHYAHAASGHKLSALTGFNHMAGWPDREPGWVGTYTDFVAPRFNLIAILAALEYRRRTGKGQLLDMSQYEPSLHFMGPAILDYTVNGRVANREGNKNWAAAPHNAYQCRGEQRWCAVAVYTDEQWQSFCKVIGNPEWTRDTRFNTLAGRKEHEEELDIMVNSWTRDRQAEEVAVLMQSAGVPAGVVESVEDQIVYDPQLKARNFFWEFDPPEPSKDPAADQPFYRLSLRVRQGPALGQHNDYVFKMLLGLSDDEMAQLAKEGVIA